MTHCLHYRVQEVTSFVKECWLNFFFINSCFDVALKFLIFWASIFISEHLLHPISPSKSVKVILISSAPMQMYTLQLSHYSWGLNHCPTTCIASFIIAIPPPTYYFLFSLPRPIHSYVIHTCYSIYYSVALHLKCL